MNKFFYFFATALVAFSFASCEPNKPSISRDDDNDDKPKKEAAFQITMGEVTATDASFIITPADPETPYFWTVYPKLYCERTIETNEDISSEEDYIKGWLVSLKTAIVGHNPVKQFRIGTTMISAEEVRYVISEYSVNLCPNYEYHIAVCNYNENLEVVGDIVFQTFNTLIPEGYVDLGLPSHNLWNCNYVLDEGTPVYFIRYQLDDFSNEWLENYESFPNEALWRELRDNCTWSWNNDLSSVNGDPYYKDIRGCVVTGPNGNKIYLPAVGGKNQYGTLTDVGYNGNYWVGDWPSETTARYVWFGSGSNSFSIDNVSPDCALSLCLVCPPGEWYYD